jgi:hypothetical protein
MSGGTITLAKNDEADMRKYFDYARACGMPMMVWSDSGEREALGTAGKRVRHSGSDHESGR